MNPIFLATIKKGKVIFENVDLLNGYLISLEGKEVEIIVRKRKKNRTIPQNNYYWSCVVGLAAEHFGYEPDEMHEAFKWQFLRRHEEGKPETVRSTTSLTTIEFTEYIEKCRQFCAEEGVVIPDPNEIDIGTSKPEPLKPTRKNIKEHQAVVEKDAEERKNKIVSSEFLADLLGWAGKGKITEEKIIQLSIENFNKEPRFLTQLEAEQLDTIIISELNK